MHKIIVIILSVFLVSCVSLSKLPEPSKSEYFTTMGGGFVTTLGNSPALRYGVNLILTKPLPENIYVIVEFQNPANSAQPFLVEGTFEEVRDLTNSYYKNLLVLKSPSVKGVTQHTNYLVKVKVYSNNSAQTLITEHQQFVNSEYIEN